MTGSTSVKISFISNWKLFAPAVMRYARKNKGKKGIATALELLDDTGEGFYGNIQDA